MKSKQVTNNDVMAAIRELEILIGATVDDVAKSGEFLIDLLRDLTSSEDCMLDHDGNCQAHNWFGEGECPHARAKRVLGG